MSASRHFGPYKQPGSSQVNGSASGGSAIDRRGKAYWAGLVKGAGRRVVCRAGGLCAPGGRGPGRTQLQPQTDSVRVLGEPKDTVGTLGCVGSRHYVR